MNYYEMRNSIRNQSVPQLLARLWPHISGRRRLQLFFVLLLIIVAAIAEMISIGAVLPFLSILIAPEKVYSSNFAKPLIHDLGLTYNNQLILVLTIFFCITAFFASFCRFAMLWASTRLSFGIGFDLGASAYRRALYQPYSFHISNNTSSVIGAINKASNCVLSTILPALNLISSVIMLSAILLTLIFIDPQVAIIVFGGFGIIYTIIIKASHRSLFRQSQCVALQANQTTKFLQEGLGGIRDILIDGTQEVFCRLHASADLPARYAAGSNIIISFSPHYFIEALAIALIVAVSYFLSLQDGGLMVAIPMLGALALGAQKMMPMMQKIYSSWTDIKASQASLQDALILLDQPILGSQNQEASPTLRFDKSIFLDSIYFSYGIDAPKVLNDVTLKIEKGSKIGFIGKTGCGKSTLLDVVMGLLTPTQGKLLVDDVAIDSHNKSGWQKHIAHVPQSIFLADASIKENIAFGVPKNEIDMDKVVKSAKMAALAESIDSWGSGYETMVGERGVRMSGGQRQRIGIARAFYKAADVLIFDEATSALDRETEDFIMNSINELAASEGKGFTVLIIAHRLTTLKECDTIYELSHGKILRSGTYREIVSS
jgi:ATP-binding cassette subfamily B protein